MKSAYERALERMEEQGIEPPRADAIDDKTRTAIADIRTKADAKLAELEIYHQGRLQGVADPAAREEEEAKYRVDRQRVEAQRDADIATLRG